MTENPEVQRVRDVLLSYGEPISEGTLARGMNLPVKIVSACLKILESNNQAQKGMRGWRAL